MGPLLSFTCFGDAVSNSLQSKIGGLISLLWDLSLGAVTNLILLPRNAGKLDEDMGILRDLRDDLGRKALSEAAQPDMEVKNQVKGWLQRVEKLDSEVSNFQSSFERQSICITGLYLGYAAADKLKQVHTLMGQGNSFNSVVDIEAPDAETLARETDELRTLRDDIKRRVESEEAANLQMRRTNLVRSWLDRAEACLLQPSEGDFEVSSRLREVRRLKKQVDGDLGGRDLVTQVPPDAVEELPNLPSSHIVGGEETLAEIRRHLSNDAVGVIGVHGMGGVGKTTFLGLFYVITDSKDVSFSSDTDHTLNSSTPINNTSFTVGSISEKPAYTLNEKDYLYHDRILSNLHDTQYDIYCSIPTARELWKVLEDKYGKEDVVLQTYEFLNIVCEIKSRGQNMDENLIVSYLIDKLPPSWHNFARSLQHKHSKISLDEFQYFIRIEEEQRKLIESKNSSNVKLTENNNKNKNYNNPKFQNQNSKFHNKKAYYRWNQNYKAKGKKFKNKSNQKCCYVCGRPGHFAKNCYERKDGGKLRPKFQHHGHNQTSNPQVNMITSGASTFEPSDGPPTKV